MRAFWNLMQRANCVGNLDLLKINPSQARRLARGSDACYASLDVTGPQNNNDDRMMDSFRRLFHAL